MFGKMLLAVAVGAAAVPRVSLYFSAGEIAGSTESAACDGLVILSETSNMLTRANSTQARRYVYGGAASSTKSYFGGGLTGAAVDRTDAITHADDTSSQVTKGALSVTKNSSAGFAASNTGYWSGGENGTLISSTSGLSFGADTTAQVTKGALSVTTGYHGAAESSIKGYSSGGFSGSSYVRVATTHAMVFADEGSSQLTRGSLSVARSDLNGTASATKVYFSGGNSGARVATTDGLTTSDDTTAMVTKGALGVATEGNMGVESTAKGYWSGGRTATNPVSTTYGLNFSDEETAMVTKGALATARIDGGAA